MTYNKSQSESRQERIALRDEYWKDRFKFFEELNRPVSPRPSCYKKPVEKK